jgi:octaprenyl-diphosphate synthase
VLSQKGKYIRPIMVYSTARMFGEVNQTCHNGAVLLELVHTATLVHDDVVDEADLRRGKPSVNAVWENKRAILVGDYLFAKAMKIATESREYKLFDIISPTVLNMSIGELIQLNSSIQNDFTEDTYYEIIQNKTASLISTCCKVGSYAAGTDEVAQKIMAEFGFNAGMAFQIKDDIFDYTRNNKTGKTEGNDIVERKATLPLIGALKNSSGRKKENLLQYWKNGKDVEYIKNLAFDFVHENGGIEYSEKVMQKYHNKALQTIAAFDDSEAKTAMIELLDFIVKRKN